MSRSEEILFFVIMGLLVIGFPLCYFVFLKIFLDE